MKHKEFILVTAFFFLLIACFFYKTVLHGYIPFPGDLLIAEYKPWSTYSYLGYNPASYPNKAQYFDVLRQLYPWKTFSINLLKQGIFPLWNPYNFSGTPLFANFQSAVLYPLNIFYFLLPFVWAWTILIMLQPFLAGIFTYFFSRKIGVSKWASMFSSISFAFSSFLTVWLEYNTIGHVIMWLPLALLACEHLFEKKSIPWMLVLIFSFVAAIFAGHPQIFVYEYLFVIVYWLYRLKIMHQFNRSNVLFFSVLMVLPLAIGTIQILPGAELIKQSARSIHPYDFLIHKILIQPWQLIMFFVPDFFGNPATRNYWPQDTYVGRVTSIGAVASVFLFFSFWKLKNRFIQFFAVSGFIVLLFTTLNPFTAAFYAIEIPFVSSSAPTLAIFLFCFSVAILSGFGVDIFLKEMVIKKKLLKILTPFFIILIGIYLYMVFLPKTIIEGPHFQLQIAERNSIVPLFLFTTTCLLLLFSTFKQKTKTVIIVILFVLQLADVGRSFTKFNPFVPQELVFPNNSLLSFLQKQAKYDRFWGYGNAGIEANFATQYKIFSPDGYDPLYPKRYGEFIQSSHDGKIHTNFTNQTRSDAKVSQQFGIRAISSNQYRLKVLDMLSVKYLFDRVENGTDSDDFPPDRFTLISQENGWKIFQNKKAAPRVFLTADYGIFHTNEEFERQFFSEKFDPSKQILLEQNPHAIAPNTNPSGKAEIVSYQPNRVEIQVDALQNALLFLSDVDDKGWGYTIDGATDLYYRANYAFRAIPVTKGKHTVVFSYAPKAFTYGMWVSAIGILLTFLVCILYSQDTVHIEKKRKQT